MKLEYTAVTDLQWANEARSAVTMTVSFNSLGDVPFTAAPDDTTEHGRELFARAVAGDFGSIREPDTEDAMVFYNLRQQAQIELDASDRTVLRCYEKSIQVPSEWAEYRNDLREIIRATAFDSSMKLPTRPPFPSDA
ncbi:hypothetical protein [Aquitalea aquatica]|uniref:Uncharacterized protein n=1 Tax=Aquitalea aquatica TaxID=3044273 RepID=A0A838XZG5_9NEIS|nr:hypothetical protein [Aquitalea magnusonii]MBA4707786.1 hypothetical protein [Aquitalea magnusonii]